MKPRDSLKYFVNNCGYSILNLKHTKTELSYDASFLHMDMPRPKQQIDTVIPSGITVWF